MTKATKAHAPARKSGYEMWQDGIDKADADWDAYDDEIQSVVNAYNHHLAATPSYLPLDWGLIKAVLWVEQARATRNGNRNPCRSAARATRG